MSRTDNNVIFLKIKSETPHSSQSSQHEGQERRPTGIPKILKRKLKKTGGGNFYEKKRSSTLRYPPLLRCQRTRHQPPRSPSRGQPNPLWPQRTLLPPYPHQRTNERMLSWSTSNRTCDRYERTPQRWRWSWRSCRRLSEPWPSHHLEQQLVAGS